MGKAKSSGYWCPNCNANKLMQQAGATGILWTNANIIIVFNLRRADYNVNKGIVKYMLFKYTEPDHFLFAVIHQLLGTGNDAQKKLYHISNEVFETWDQEVIALIDKFIEAEGEKFNWRVQNKQTLPTLITKSKYSTMNLHISLPQKIYSKIQFTRRPLFLPSMCSVILDDRK